MLTTADLVAMLVLSTMLVLSRYRATVQKYPFPEKKSIVDVVLCQHRDSRVDCEEIIRLKKMKRWPALQPPKVLATSGNCSQNDLFRLEISPSAPIC